MGMGILDRLSTLLRANINDLLDKAEDPEKALNLYLRDTETSIRQAREQVASMIAQEKEIEADLGNALKMSEEWRSKAQRAAKAGKDDLAREALKRKNDNAENAAVYQQQLSAQEQTVSKLKQQLQALESKYQSTMSRRDTLMARQRRARAQETVARSVQEFSIDPTADAERWERQIRSTEARAAALNEMNDDTFDAQFRELDTDVDIENELAMLKGQAPAAISAATEPAAGETPAIAPAASKEI